MKKIKLKLVEIFYGYHCNLSCQGCTSASDIIKDNLHDPSLESIYLSIENLSCHVEPDRIDLMGGELFLYWDRVEKIITKIRYHFPKTTIGLATNGLLLSKYEDRLLELCEKFHPCLIEITDHFVLFSDEVISKKYHSKLNKILSKLTKTVEIKWKIDPLKLKKNTDWRTATHKDESYYHNNTKISVVTSPEFIACYFKDKEGKLKPYATNDPEGSYKNGCAMKSCHMVMNSKLYKCSWFAVLPSLLTQINQIEDADWQKYLNYSPVNLINPSEESLIEFEKTSTSSITLCDMCANNRANIINQTKDNVLNTKK